MDSFLSYKLDVAYVLARGAMVQRPSTVQRQGRVTCKKSWTCTVQGMRTPAQAFSFNLNLKHRHNSASSSLG